ncbi:MAG TPA: hypothetical protein VF331_10850 [Polyangiales bacterium]|jgi:hypothetical protein
MSEVEACTDVRAFFREQVAEALRSLDVKTAEHTEHYLVNLLAGYSVSERIQELSAPFVEQLGQALAHSGAARTQRLRALGDAALFVSGFLSDSCDRRGVTPVYVIAIGARAYGEVGRAPAAGATARPDLFLELAQRFESFARVLDEVREQTAMCSDGDLVRLYERWRVKRSPRILRRLRRRGVTPGHGSRQIN